MAKLFLVVRKADNLLPVADGVNGCIVVAADAAAARTAAKALVPGDPDSAWDASGADTYDLSGTAFTVGEVAFKTSRAPVAPSA